LDETQGTVHISTANDCFTAKLNDGCKKDNFLDTTKKKVSAIRMIPVRVILE
jgi:hypothetical protein